MAFPPPPVTLRQRSSTFAEPLRPPRRVLFQRVLLVFIRVTQESLATFSSRAFRLQRRASLETTAACWISLTGVTAPFADPFVGLESRNLRDMRFILYCTSEVKFFMCFIFRPPEIPSLCPTNSHRPHFHRSHNLFTANSFHRMVFTVLFAIYCSFNSRAQGFRGSPFYK